jgi:hypothetical protein
MSARGPDHRRRSRHPVRSDVVDAFLRQIDRGTALHEESLEGDAADEAGELVLAFSGI